MAFDVNQRGLLPEGARRRQHEHLRSRQGQVGEVFGNIRCDGKQALWQLEGTLLKSKRGLN